MNDSFGGDFLATQTGGVDGGAANERKAEGIAPVLIKQILESPEGHFQMWGMTFGMVACAVIVRSIETSSTKITYLLEDHTGRIEAHYWLEEGDTLKAPDVMLNNYVKAYGSVRSQGGQKTLMVFKMLPITDPNEVSTHVLEVLNSRYKAEEYSTKGAGGAGYSGFGKNELGSFGIQNNAGTNTLGLDAKQLAVFQAIKSNVTEEGITRQELRKRFSHIKADELDSILDFMANEGHIYSSVDPDHFVCTES